MTSFSTAFPRSINFVMQLLKYWYFFIINNNYTDSFHPHNFFGRYQLLQIKMHIFNFSTFIFISALLLKHKLFMAQIVSSPLEKKLGVGPQNRSHVYPSWLKAASWLMSGHRRKCTKWNSGCYNKRWLLNCTQK